MGEQDSVQIRQELLAEHVAALDELVVANSTITTLTETAGIPVEHLEAEFRVETRARAKLVDVRRRMDQFDVDHAESLPIG